MNRRIVLALAAVIVTLAVVWLFRFKLPRQSPPSRRATSTPAVVAEPKFDVTPSNVQIDTASVSQEDVRSEVRRRDAQDSKWEWKIPIAFYGKVVDENGQPIAAAEVAFQW